MLFYLGVNLKTAMCDIIVHIGKFDDMCPDYYRVFDLKSIEWDSLDVIAISGDVGTIKYIHNNGSWER
jgi:hypothetical protein